MEAAFPLGYKSRTQRQLTDLQARSSEESCFHLDLLGS